MQLLNTLMLLTVTVQLGKGTFLLNTQKLYLPPVRQATTILEKRLYCISITHSPIKKIEVFPRVT